MDPSDWRPADSDTFFDQAVAALFDHGRAEFIVSMHLVKTVLAVREEVTSGEAGAAAVPLIAALNRFLGSPLKRRHLRCAARQAMTFVALDG